MEAAKNPEQFEVQWLGVAEEICKRIYLMPEIQAMKKRFQGDGTASLQDRSDFISIANKVKYEVIHELFGPAGSKEYLAFRDAWRNWFDHKAVPKFQAEHRRLTNAEHIVYSSTPDLGEFLQNS